MPKEGRRALDGEECREGGLRRESGGISDVSMTGTEGVRRFLSVLEGSCNPSSLEVGLICVSEERPKMVFLRGFEPASRLSDLRMLPSPARMRKREQSRVGHTEGRDASVSLGSASQRDVKNTKVLR